MKPATAAPAFDDTAFIGDPDQWPQWPQLPLKRLVKGQAWPQLGVLVDTGGPEFVVVIHSMFEKSDAETPRCTYNSIAAMRADGWRVD